MVRPFLFGFVLISLYAVLTVLAIIFKDSQRKSISSIWTEIRTNSYTSYVSTDADWRAPLNVYLLVSLSFTSESAFHSIGGGL